MEIVLLATSLALFAALVWDVFITVLSSKGAGPFSVRWYRLVWRVLLRLHARRPIHGVLALAGPFMLLASIVLWYVMLALALWLALAAVHGSVVDSRSGDPVGLLQLLYFVNTTTSSLGYGDTVPARFPWTLVSTLATLVGTIIITLSLSYVLSVLNAAIERRKLARGIFGLGATPPQLIANASLHAGRDSLKVHVLALASQIDHQALRHLAYPVVKYFHSAEPGLSLARALVQLSDACFLLGLMPGDRRPPQGLLHVVEGSIENFVQLSKLDVLEMSEPDHDPAELLAWARELGVGEALEGALPGYLQRRRRLFALRAADGWREG